MKTIHISTLLGLLAFEASAASGSCKDGIIDITLVGYASAGTPYPNYTISVPEDGSTMKLTNPMAVYSITPPDNLLDCFTKCTFLAADGATNGYTGSTIDPSPANLDDPQPQIAVACTTADALEAPCKTAASYTDSAFEYSCTREGAYGAFPTPSKDAGSSSATTTASASPTTASSVVPPYPTVTGSATVAGSTGSAVSTGYGAKGTGGVGGGVIGGGNGTAKAPFTGAARRVAGSVGSSLLAAVGIVVAL